MECHCRTGEFVGVFAVKGVANYTDYHDELAWIALQRNGGSPVTLEDVTSMFSDLRAHKRNCRCECRWERQALPDKVYRCAQYWSRCSRSVLG